MDRKRNEGKKSIQKKRERERAERGERERVKETYRDGEREILETNRGQEQEVMTMHQLAMTSFWTTSTKIFKINRQ